MKKKESWKKLILKASKNKNYLGTLEALWQGEVSSKEVKKVSYRTAIRILNKFEELGLVGYREEDSKKIYSLNSLGRVIACLLLGKFKSYKKEVEEVEASMDKEEVYIGREELKEEVIFNIERKRSIFIKAPKGYGKTTFLRNLAEEVDNSLYVMSRPKKYFMEEIAQEVNISLKREDGRRKRTIKLLKDIIKKKRKESVDLVILLDELEYMPRRAQEFAKKLRRAGFTVVAAGTEKPEKLEFKDELELKPLSKEKSKRLIMKLLSQEFEDPPEKLVKLILRKVGGSPEKIKDYTDDVIIARKKGDFEVGSRESVHKFFNKLKNISGKKINLISGSLIMAMGTLFLGMRYLFYGQEKYQLGYLFAMIAYFIYFFYRWRRYS